ncbi:hypothetical protein PSECIP111951_01714 [Pseudoalteromonas holothuriae]|uniref:Uncharacterized protein n=1 Tax=Pseudoalteromonas holothuriae TaxID=2963714 RepID=A0A9W4QTE5_9GAMM|nr:MULTISPECIES: hypothetical protein [unclassified Pseudoalteromonas]CAH9052113.1 hypothetical protein PSECIP111854_00902 [Pseudoalteromonas sp. CIP111854]CAH9057666.1 hypothetical protein PSECIP111951_01714 [Pseudoalteromonas sp. CIP111951]
MSFKPYTMAIGFAFMIAAIFLLTEILGSTYEVSSFQDLKILLIEFAVMSACFFFGGLLVDYCR